MKESTAKRAALFSALVLFLAFLANVATSRSMQPPILGDVGEAVTLFAAVAFFVVGILLEEATAKADRT